MNKFKEGKTLITYYSREGNNYVNGCIVNLPVGNTEVAAKMIQKITGGELFCINTIKKYPEDYTKPQKLPSRNCVTMQGLSFQRILKILMTMKLSFWAIPTGGEPCRCRYSLFSKNTILLERPFFHSAPTKEAAWGAVKAI